MAKYHFISWFKDIDKEDVGIVGGKGANLGEMTKAHFPVPNGFVITALAYFHFLKENALTTKIRHLLETVNPDKPESLQQVSTHIKDIIMKAKMSEYLAREIIGAYKVLGGSMMQGLVAVRSSATAEDLPEASFAGQQETFLNVQGEANLLLSVKKAWASLFEARAIFYRSEHKYNHFKVGIAVVVQKMVASEKSGVMFTIDPVTNDKSSIVIEAILGLGELIVQGKVTPDHYVVSKTDGSIKEKVIAKQDVLMKRVGASNKIASVPILQRKKQKINDEQIQKLAHLGKLLERHYYFPQDIEWSIERDQIYIVQTRPVTTITKPQKENGGDFSKMELLLKGSPASPGIASGPVKIIQSMKEIAKVSLGDVLVAMQTNPDFVPAMKKASAIVTERGGRTSHAAIVSRELGVPAVVGAEGATKKLRDSLVVTVHGNRGEVYKGSFTATTGAANVTPSIKTATKIYVNLAQPDIAERVSKMDCDGIGLLRAEFMMANIGIHPKKMLREGRKREYISQLAEQLEIFCKPFFPRPVVYRTADFKTNEYRGLIGGKAYEPTEENPMLGYRGAFRYLHDPEVFDLELEAIKIVRNKMNLRNLWVMLPFVRTVRELYEVKKLISSAGIYRSSSFKLWMMVEVPSNFILLDEFIDVGIDGVSIGSNDLTMLILGTDRDNSEVASIYDEQNPAVLWALERIITIAQKRHVTVSICGQAPSQYPDLVEKLVRWGITSVSVSPDVIGDTRRIVYEAEKKMVYR